MFRHLPLVLILIFTLAGCAQRAESPALYTDLGGQPGIAAIVRDLLYRIADDRQLVHFFANTNIDHFATSLEQQLCDLADGPCRYHGPPMDRAHQHMGITNADFNRLVSHMEKALIAQGVDLGTRNRLLGRLAPLHGEIMLRQSPPPSS